MIGYYEGWANNRTCDSWSPSDLAVDGLTHLNYAFATFDHNGDNWVVSPMTGVANEDEVINDLVDLKSNSPGLSSIYRLEVGHSMMETPRPTGPTWPARQAVARVGRNLSCPR